MPHSFSRLSLGMSSSENLSISSEMPLSGLPCSSTESLSLFKILHDHNAITTTFKCPSYPLETLNPLKNGILGNPLFMLINRYNGWNRLTLLIAGPADVYNCPGNIAVVSWSLGQDWLQSNGVTFGDCRREEKDTEKGVISDLTILVLESGVGRRVCAWGWAGILIFHLA